MVATTNYHKHTIEQQHLVCGDVRCDVTHSCCHSWGAAADLLRTCVNISYHYQRHTSNSGYKMKDNVRITLVTMNPFEMQCLAVSKCICCEVPRTWQWELLPLENGKLKNKKFANRARGCHTYDSFIRFLQAIWFYLIKRLTIFNKCTYRWLISSSCLVGWSLWNAL